MAQFSFDVGLASKFYSAKPLETEPTPNFQGAGPTLKLGYYLHSPVQVAIHYESLASTTGKISAYAEDANYTLYGGSIGFRIMQTVLVSLDYSEGLFAKKEEIEIEGFTDEYKSSGIGLEIGSFLLRNRRKMRQNNLQISFQMQTHTFTPEDTVTFAERSVDAIGIKMVYTFTAKQRSAFKSGLFKSFFF